MVVLSCCVLHRARTRAPSPRLPINHMLLSRLALSSFPPFTLHTICRTHRHMFREVCKLSLSLLPPWRVLSQYVARVAWLYATSSFSRIWDGAVMLVHIAKSSASTRSTLDSDSVLSPFPTLAAASSASRSVRCREKLVVRMRSSRS